MTDNLDLFFGLVLFILLPVIGRLGLQLTHDHRDTMWFQIKLFVTAYVVRFAASIAIYQFGVVSVLGDEDSSGWFNGVLLQQQWAQRGIGLLDLPVVMLGAFEGHQRGYGYLLGALFYITDSPGRIPAAALNCFLGALTVVFAYRMARSTFSEWAAVRAGWFACFFPSMIIWSAQTLKEPVVILLETLALYGCLRLKLSGFSYRHVLLCALAIVLVAPFRFYAAYIAGAAVVLTLALPDFRKGKISIGSAIGVAALVIPLLAMTGVLIQHEAEFERLDLKRIEKFRGNVAEGLGAASGVQQDYNLKNPVEFALAAAVGGAHLMLAPFPWQLRGGSTRMLLTAPELVVWWWLFLVGVLPGLWQALRTRFNEIQPMLFFVFGLGLLYSVMFGNVGLAYRQRAQLLPWLLVFAAVGLERRALRRLAARKALVGREALVRAQL